VRVTSIDNNGARLALSTTSLALDEGGSGTFTVALSKDPGSDFTVTVAAAEDADNVRDTATLTVAAAGGDARTVSVTVKDNDPSAPSITSTPITGAVVGAPYRYDVVAEGLPAPSFSLTSSGHYYYGREHNRWNTSALKPGSHMVRMVVYDTAGKSAEAEVKVCVGDGPCVPPGPDDGGTEPPVDSDGCGCGAGAGGAVGWLALVLFLRRRRANTSPGPAVSK
jgi:hypothetical protein